MEKTMENNWKVKKTGWVISQVLALGQKHDKISNMMNFKYLVK